MFSQTKINFLIKTLKEGSFLLSEHSVIVVLSDHFLPNTNITHEVLSTYATPHAVGGGIHSLLVNQPPICSLFCESYCCLEFGLS